METQDRGVQDGADDGEAHARGRVADERADRSETDADVLIVGGGPAGLMLAAELRLGGVRPLVLERHAELGRTHNANGLGGQIIELLRYRGLRDRFVAAATNASPRAVYPFGGVHVDLTGLADPPLKGMQLQHPSVDRLLDERAVELGADIRRGHRVVAVHQDAHAVTAEVEGPDGPAVLTGRYLVGCDGAYSRIRGMVGIGFPGVTYPEVHRLAEVTVPASVTVRDDGGVEVPGGRITAGFTRTERGVFAMGALTPGVLMVQTIEDEGPADGDGPPMTLDELGASIRRVLGVELPLGEPRRLSRYRHHARQAERYRAGRVFLAGDAAHVLPATGTARSVGMLDAVNLGWKLAADLRGRAPEGLLDTYEEERHHAGARALLQTQAQVALRRGDDDAADALRAVFSELLEDEAAARRLGALISGADVRYPAPRTIATGAGASAAAAVPASDLGPDDGRHPLAGRFAPDLPLRTDGGTERVAGLMHEARTVLLVLADCPEIVDAAGEWRGRVDLRVARTDDRPADALLIRPDAHVAWAAEVGAPAGAAAAQLREALTAWVGTP
jgi:2-polyprenyl-6-methoxyphenol hydroxylase-like FAD-dependent oxidoreductase